MYRAIGRLRAGESYRVAAPLVTKPLVRMDDLTSKNGALSCHREKEYHKRSVLDMQDFDSVFVHGDSNVHTRLDQARTKKLSRTETAFVQWLTPF